MSLSTKQKSTGEESGLPLLKYNNQSEEVKDITRDRPASPLAHTLRHKWTKVLWSGTGEGS